MIQILAKNVLPSSPSLQAKPLAILPATWPTAWSAPLRSAARHALMVSKFWEESAPSYAPSPIAILAQQKTPAPSVLQVRLSLKASSPATLTAVSLDVLTAVAQQPAPNAIRVMSLPPATAS